MSTFKLKIPSKIARSRKVKRKIWGLDGMIPVLGSFFVENAENGYGTPFEEYKKERNKIRKMQESQKIA